MPKYEVEWTSKGTATVEADDADEAESYVKEAVTDFDTLMLEEFEVDEVEITDTSLTEEEAT